MVLLHRVLTAASLSRAYMLLVSHSTAPGSQVALEVWIGLQLLLNVLQEVLHGKTIHILRNSISRPCSPLLPMAAFKHLACMLACFDRAFKHPACSGLLALFFPSKSLSPGV